MPAERHESTVAPPLDPASYVDFPAYAVEGATAWHRVHHRRHSPWWYSCAPGRFNLREPRGTLNTASSPETAVREMLGPRLVGSRRIPGVQVAGLLVTPLEPGPLRVADLLSGRAARYGAVAGDMSAPREDAYALTRAWAKALDEAGFDGVRSRARFGAGSCPECLYVFGPAGEHEAGASGESLKVPALLEREMDLAVDPVLDSADLVMED